MPRFGWKPLIAVVAVCVAAAIAYGVYHYRPLNVSVLPREKNVSITIFGLGTIEARLLSKIGFKVAGTITALEVDHGDRVGLGQVLARIDDREQKARVAKARAQVVNAETAVRVAEAAANKAAAVASQRAQISARRQSLLVRNAVSQEAAEEAQLNEGIAKAELLVARSEIDSAKARLDDARAQLDFEQVILAQHELRAPFDGVIVARNKELGAILPAGDPLFTLIVPESAWLLAYVDEARAGDIQVGQHVETRLRSLPQQRFQGKVARIGIESDRVNEERRVYITCEACPQDLFLGEQAEAHITTATLDAAVLVPEILIESFDDTSGIVWTIEDGRLNRRPVKFGKRTIDNRHEIVDGLPPGAAVAADVGSGFRIGRPARAAQGAAP